MSPAGRAARAGTAAVLRVHGEPVDAETATGTYTGLVAAFAADPMTLLPDEQHRDRRQRVTVYLHADAPHLEIGDTLTDKRGTRWRITGILHEAVCGMVAYMAVADSRLGLQGG